MEKESYNWIINSVDSMKPKAINTYIMKDMTVDETKRYVIAMLKEYVKDVGGHFIAGTEDEDDLSHWLFECQEDKTLEISGWCIYEIEELNKDLMVTDTMFRLVVNACVLDRLIEEYDQAKEDGIISKNIGGNE